MKFAALLAMSFISFSTTAFASSPIQDLSLVCAITQVTDKPLYSELFQGGSLIQIMNKEAASSNNTKKVNASTAQWKQLFAPYMSGVTINLPGEKEVLFAYLGFSDAKSDALAIRLTGTPNSIAGKALIGIIPGPQNLFKKPIVIEFTTDTLQGSTNVVDPSTGQHKEVAKVRCQSRNAY